MKGNKENQFHMINYPQNIKQVQATHTTRIKIEKEKKLSPQRFNALATYYFCSRHRLFFYSFPSNAIDAANNVSFNHYNNTFIADFGINFIWKSLPMDLPRSSFISPMYTTEKKACNNIMMFGVVIHWLIFFLNFKELGFGKIWI